MFENIKNADLRDALERFKTHVDTRIRESSQYASRRFNGIFAALVLALVVVIMYSVSLHKRIDALPDLGNDVVGLSDDIDEVESDLAFADLNLGIDINRESAARRLLETDLQFLQSRVYALETSQASATTETSEVSVPALQDDVTNDIPDAGDEDEECVLEDEVTYLRYAFNDAFPIPVDTFVQFVSVCNGDIAMKWINHLGNGKVTTYYVFDGVRMDYIYFTEPGRSSTYQARRPIAGDSGTFVNNRDSYDVELEFGSDGIVDVVTVVEIREWTEEEQVLFDLGNQFYDEAVSQNWFYFWYATDCSASEYRINGEPAEAGPYGFTYSVPSEGATFEAFYEEGHCGYSQDGVRWSLEVHPGDAVVGTEEITVFSMKDQDPWRFCGRLYRMRPVWQPQYLSPSMEGVCYNLWGQNDQGPLALLAREGFLRADTRFGDDLAEDWVPFVFDGGVREIEFSWPVHTWEVVDSIELSAVDVFTVSHDVESNAPIISYVGGDHGSSSAYGSDIPWYGGYGTPIVFVQRENVDDYYFDWELTQVYRILLVNGEIVIEQAIWVTTE